MSKLISINALFLIKGKSILGVNPPVTDFAFFDLWSKPMGLLYLLEKMRELGNHAEFIDCIHEGAVGAKTFGREKIGSVEISKPSVYAGIRRYYHRFGMSEEALRRRLREVYRLHQSELKPGWDILLVARTRTLSAPWGELTGAFCRLARRLDLLEEQR